MKEIDPVVAAIADSLWQKQQISRATGEMFPAPPPGAGDPLVQAMMLNQSRRDFSPSAPSAPYDYAPSPQKPGMMAGPAWMGLDFPLADIVSPLGAHIAQSLLGGSGTGDDGLAQFLPGAGDAIDAWTALRLGGQAIGQGLEGNWSDAGQLGSWAAIAAMGAVPGLDAPSTQGIRAYHGSPHDFDQFSLEKIGTGEGAKAYGHGLYFAENEGVAKTYQEQLAGKGWYIDGQEVGRYGGPRRTPTGTAAAWLNRVKPEGGIITAADIDAAMAAARDVADAPHNKGLFPPEYLAEVENAMRPLVGRHLEQRLGGKTYEVNIKANPEDFLDWDKPLSEQSEKVRAALGWTQEAEQAYKSAQGADDAALLAALAGDGGYTAGRPPVPPGLPPLSATGADIVKGNSVFDSAADVAKTAALREKGIPGIKYLDQGSRAAGGGSRNYVVFDDKLIDIVRKYGIAGLLALPALGMFGGGDAEASQ